MGGVKFEYDCRCPTLLYNFNMKRSPFLADHIRERELIAFFDSARLIKTLAGKFELHGGTEEDKKQAKAWTAIFLAESNVTFLR
ncbi:MAG: hypothetical protein JWM68_3901 [Verrucomicrobiales bacterium]|nr:hypothetical protein [Verrucomicrobiales bacterium]